MNRRNFIRSALLAGGAVALYPYLSQAANKGSAMIENSGKLTDFDKWQLSEDQWSDRLTSDQYYVMRREGTERAYSNTMEAIKTTGIYHCAGCDLASYSSDHKFESGTGWPSFYQPINIAFIATKTDFKSLWPRTEVHCARCGGHQGHIFKDGPKPTGLRYCLNSASLIFKAA